MNKKYYYAALYGSLINLLPAVFFGGEVTYQYVLLLSFGNFFSWQIANLVGYIFTLLPFLMQIYLFSTILYEDIDRAAAYIFTRTRNRHTWYRQKVLALVGSSVVYYLSSALILLIVWLVSNPAFGGSVWEGLAGVGLSIAANTLVLFIVNILTLFIKEHYVFLITWGSFFPLMFLTALIIEATGGAFWLVALPTTHVSAFWHDAAYIHEMGTTLTYIQGFRLWHSAFYIALAYVVVYVWGLAVINRKDLTLLRGD